MGEKKMTALAAYQNEFEPPSGRLTTSAFGINRTPIWLVSTSDRIIELVRLPFGWDGHDGRPVNFDVADFAVQILLQTLELDGPAPLVVPLSYGGLQLEWHEQGIDLEIEVEAPNRIFVSFEDRETGETFEQEFSTDYTEVTRIMRILASRPRY